VDARLKRVNVRDEDEGTDVRTRWNVWLFAFGPFSKSSEWPLVRPYRPQRLCSVE